MRFRRVSRHLDRLAVITDDLRLTTLTVSAVSIDRDGLLVLVDWHEDCVGWRVLDRGWYRMRVHPRYPEVRAIDDGRER